MKTFRQRLKGWRTIIVACLLGLAPIWDVALQLIPVLAADPDLPRLIPPAWMPAYSLAVTVAMIWMRVLTTTGLGRRQ